MLILIENGRGFDRRMTDPVEFSGSAGANRGCVTVELRGFPQEFFTGKAIPGTAKMVQRDQFCCLEYQPGGEDRLIVVFAHSSAAGTFHGIGVASVAASCSYKGEYDVNACGRSASGNHQGHQFVAGDQKLFVGKHAGVRWEATSSSGGGCISGAVAVLKTGDPHLAIIVSGYDGRRGWRVITATPAGVVETKSREEYMAAHSVAEVL